MILILDDHPLVREGLTAIISDNEPESVILQAGTVEEAIKIAKKETPDMAFIDIRLEKDSGLNFLEWLNENLPKCKTFVITSSMRRQDFLDAKNMNVDAYVLKDAFVDEIIYAIKAVNHGKKFYSSAIIHQLDKISEDERLFSCLTLRECEVLCMLSKGLSNSKIATSLFVSEGTIKKHISNILMKLNLTNRVEVVIFAGRNAAAISMMLENSFKDDLRKGAI